MPSTKLMTTSLLLTPDQSRLLKSVAAARMMRGEQQTASVSEVIRNLLDEHDASFRKEVEGLK